MVTLSNVIPLAKSCGVYYDTAIYDRRGQFRQLCSDVVFGLSNGQILTIKKGFTWDENSIPFVLQPFFPKSGIYATPALIHDALYYDSTTSQEFADNEFRIWMEALNVNTRQVKFRYWGVKNFGGKWWRKNVSQPSPRCIENRNFIKIQ